MNPHRKAERDALFNAMLDNLPRTAALDRQNNASRLETLGDLLEMAANEVKAIIAGAPHLEMEGATVSRSIGLLKAWADGRRDDETTAARKGLLREIG
jgi:hypothetical protein